MAMAGSLASTRFSERSERELVLSILRDDFGDTAERIALALLRGEGLRLLDVAQRVQAEAAGIKPSLHEIKANVLKLLQHNLLTITPVPSARGAMASYAINVQEVLYRLRFPKFIELAKSAFGEEGEVIMEEMLVQGRVRMDQSIEAMAYSLAEHRRQLDPQKAEEEITDEELEDNRARIRDTFVEMAKKRYISRVHPLDMKLPEREEQPDFPAAITRGQDASSAAPSSSSSSVKGAGRKPNGAAGNAAAAADAAAANGGSADDDGITVRGKRKKPSASASNQSVPVELQMMLEADEQQRRDDERGGGEAEFETEVEVKRRKGSKRAKLPTRGGAPTAVAPSSDGDEATAGMKEQSLVWRVGVDQLMRDLRHQACVTFATENINNVAGVIVAAMLRHSSPHEREKDEPTSHPVTARELFAMREVKDALPKDSKDTWRLLLNYITVMCRDKSGMVLKVAAETFDPTQARAGDGGQYVVHMKKIVEFLRQSTSHAYISDKFGVQSARIVRLLLEKRQLEQKTIGELALLPSNDARRRLYELLREQLVQLQEIPKRADHSPAFTLYCWSVDVPRLERSVTQRVQDALTRLRRRRKLEADENKDLIARSDQLVEANDLAKFDKLSRSLDRLDRAIIQLDNMLMLYPTDSTRRIDLESPAPAMDYYEILELPRHATDQDIKKAYRKLAMKWHPDKNRHNAAEAQHRFQEVSEAYDVLSDPQKRAVFDQYGYDGLKNGVPDDNGDMRDGYAFNERASEELFTKFFGTNNPFYDFGFGDTMPFASGLRKKGPEKAEPILQDVPCSLEELFVGTTKTVTIERRRLQNDELIVEAKTFQLKIKPGWKHGTKITYEREGSETRTHEVGDVVFQVVQEKHAAFTRDAANLIFRAKIKLSEALGDYCVEVPTLDNRKLAISCNDVIHPSSEKVIKGEGMPIASKGGLERGDLIIRFDIVFPKHLTALQKQALVKILG
ncbi:hypothetical protein ATCC90586_008220 [Pythium insidiosum]|nr:hypothetical protein ATCC90586_008220 [Pythium insidiosum]